MFIDDIVRRDSLVAAARASLLGAAVARQIPLLTLIYENHGNGLPRMPGAHKGSTQVIEHGQYMSVYGRNNLNNLLDISIEEGNYLSKNTK